MFAPPAPIRDRPGVGETLSPGVLPFTPSHQEIASMNADHIFSKANAKVLFAAIEFRIAEVLLVRRRASRRPELTVLRARARNTLQ